ncbi:MAG: hypothetical protein Q7U64_11845 [Desulfocapsaceae bacterium]|nr:hypothetical protein [Desulfocapsaceae bacterium]
MSLYSQFVAAPYAVLAILVARLFIYSGFMNRVKNIKVATGEYWGFQDNRFHDKVELLCSKNMVQDLVCVRGLPFLSKDH